MRLHLWGNGAAKTPTVEEDLQMFRDAGFEILESFDHMDVGDELYVAARPWCLCARACVWQHGLRVIPCTVLGADGGCYRAL